MISKSTILSAIGLLLAAHPLPAEEAVAPFARKNEIKLFVTAQNAASALKFLKLEGKPVALQTVCFFDTAEGALGAKQLILRVRQIDGEPGESTVKIRASNGGAGLGEHELAIRPEQDWTRPDQPVLSRSLNRESLEGDLVSKVLAGEGKVIDLFNNQQRALVAGRMKDFNWQDLRRYGPVEAKVWKQQFKLQGFKEKVTAEVWHLERDGRSLDVLEVSAKAKADTEEEALAVAREFFGAAKAAGLGDPTGETKTEKVLGFFKPGH